MATSVYLAAAVSGQTSRVLNIGGTVVLQNWADGALVYTVPAGKRLVLKGVIDVDPDFSGGNHKATIRQATAPYQEKTHVFPPGSRIYHNQTTSMMCTGFLEDDS